MCAVSGIMRRPYNAGFGDYDTNWGLIDAYYFIFGMITVVLSSRGAWLSARIKHAVL